MFLLLFGLGNTSLTEIKELKVIMAECTHAGLKSQFQGSGSRDIRGLMSESWRVLQPVQNKQGNRKKNYGNKKCYYILLGI